MQRADQAGWAMRQRHSRKLPSCIEYGLSQCPCLCLRMWKAVLFRVHAQLEESTVSRSKKVMQTFFAGALVDTKCKPGCAATAAAEGAPGPVC